MGILQRVSGIGAPYKSRVRFEVELIGLTLWSGGCRRIRGLHVTESQIEQNGLVA